MAVTMALPQEKKTRGRLKQSEGEGGNGDEGKAKGYRAGGVVAMASSARRRKTAWARTVRAATHSSCRSAASPLHRPLHGQLQRWRSCGGNLQLSAPKRQYFRPLGEKFNPLPPTCCSSVQMGCFGFRIRRSGRQTGARSFSQGCLPRGGRDGQVKGRSPPFSFSGCNPARSTQVARMSRSAWWRTVRSPPAQHSTAHTHTPTQKRKKLRKKNMRYLEIWA